MQADHKTIIGHRSVVDQGSPALQDYTTTFQRIGDTAGLYDKIPSIHGYILYATLVCIFLSMSTLKDVINGDFVRHKTNGKEIQQYKRRNLCI